MQQPTVSRNIPLPGVLLVNPPPAFLLLVAAACAQLGDGRSSPRLVLPPPMTAVPTLTHTGANLSVDPALPCCMAFPSGDVDSWPLGNGRVSAVAWVSSSGLHFYLGREDSFDEQHSMMKLGLLHLTLEPNPFAGATTLVSQTLDMRSGELVVDAPAASVRLWVDAHADRVVANVTMAGQAAVVNISAELWRLASFNLTDIEAAGVRRGSCARDRRKVQADSVATTTNTVAWYHDNGNRSVLDDARAQQGLLGVNEFPDTLRYRITGALVTGIGDDTAMTALSPAESGGKADTYVLTTGSPVTTSIVEVHSRSTQCPAGGEIWLRDFRSHVASLPRVSEGTFDSHREFWQRSFAKTHLLVGAGDGCAGCLTPSAEINSIGPAGMSALGQIMNQRIAVSRYMDLAAGRGSFPQHFDGAFWTAPAFNADVAPIIPDFVKWGSGWWTTPDRFFSYAALLSGDFQLMMPLFEAFLTALPVAKERARQVGAAAGRSSETHGAVFAETWWLGGSYEMGDWSEQSIHCPHSGCPCCTPFTLNATTQFLPPCEPTGSLPVCWQYLPGHICNPYIDHHWEGGIEIAAMAGTTFSYTGNLSFARRTWLPLADAVLDFYFSYWPLVNGTLMMANAHSGETWTNCTQPAGDIGALGALLDALLSDSPATLTLLPHNSSARNKYQRMRSALPPLPIIQGKLVPCMVNNDPTNLNGENTELWSVWPFHRVGLNRTGSVAAAQLAAARQAFASRHWSSDPCFNAATQAAVLGESSEAADLLARFMQVKSPTVGYQLPFHNKAIGLFPGFTYGGDGSPDIEQGAQLRVALATMLLQPHGDGKHILLLPAWPANWTADFSLAAPNNTIVSAKVAKGCVVSELVVSPRERQDDIILMPCN